MYVEIVTGWVAVLSVSTPQDLEREQDKLKRREAKQAETEKEVKQFEQRRQVEQELAVLQVLLQYATYNQARGEFEELKGQRNEAKEHLKELEAENRPFKESET